MLDVAVSSSRGRLVLKVPPKRKRKQVVQKALGFKNVRQVERLLKQYKAGDLHEECGTKRSDTGKILIDPYWLKYMEEYWDKALKKKEKLRGIDAYRAVKCHAAVDRKGQNVPPLPQSADRTFANSRQQRHSLTTTNARWMLRTRVVEPQNIARVDRCHTRSL